MRALFRQMDRTITDFGQQFQRYPTGHNEGFYGSTEGLLDTLGPLLDPTKLRDARVAEIGAGPGRVVNILLDLGVAHVTAVEPSAAFDVPRRNTAQRAPQIAYVHARGDELPLSNYDAILSIGVLHHIEDVDPVIRRAYAALRPGGQFLAWLYGREGNELYLASVAPLRRLTTRLPDAGLAALTHAINSALTFYIKLCALGLPLPMARHMTGAMARYSSAQRFLVVFDQLNPAYAKYYTQAEAIDLFGRNGFPQVETWHRHGHSWAVRAVK